MARPPERVRRRGSVGPRQVVDPPAGGDHDRVVPALRLERALVERVVVSPTMPAVKTRRVGEGRELSMNTTRCRSPRHAERSGQALLELNEGGVERVPQHVVPVPRRHRRRANARSGARAGRGAPAPATSPSRPRGRRGACTERRRAPAAGRARPPGGTRPRRRTQRRRPAERSPSHPSRSAMRRAADRRRGDAGEARAMVRAGIETVSDCIAANVSGVWRGSASRSSAIRRMREAASSRARSGARSRRRGSGCSRSRGTPRVGPGPTGARRSRSSRPIVLGGPPRDGRGPSPARRTGCLPVHW